MPISQSEILAVFGEALLLLDNTRCVTSALGDTRSVFGSPPEDLVGLTWNELLKSSSTEAHEGLYWAVEAALEGYVASQYLPSQLPITSNYTLELRQPEQNIVALRLYHAITDKLDKLLYRDLRLSLASAAGFADVLLKGIGGPLTDIQVEDLNVIHNDSQFALNLVADWRSQWIAPRLVAPVPISALTLLQLQDSDLPRRKLANQKVAVEYDVPQDVIAYSNGAIRNALIELMRTLPQYVLKQSVIAVNAHIVEDVIELHISYHASDNGMKAAQRISPMDLFERRSLKHAGRLRILISSLHAQLSPYGCTAWAIPAESLSIATIVMTVPVWHGPTEKPF
jgi:hypothetical protein